MSAAPVRSALKTPIEVNKGLLQSTKVLRRQILRETKSETLLLQRRRVGAFVMAIIAIGVLLHRRSSYDSWIVILIESLACSVSLGVPFLFARKENRSGPISDWNAWVVGPVAFAVIIPWLIDRIARGFGFGNGFEIVMLSSLAWGGISASLIGKRARTISLSVICSGFLTLFVTFISDSHSASLFAYAWGAICLWWLVSNHWEQVESCSATQVSPARGQRLVFIGIGAAAFIFSISIVSNRIPVLHKLQAELMPTSGGTGDQDLAALGGVGNGDALIAAKEHASSFGPVESDLFLDSEKPSLFDLFSDEMGEPKKNTRVEKAQALSPNESRTEEGKSAESDRSSSNDKFSTDRTPPRKHLEVKDLASEAIFFWIGESGSRLAVERFDRFDGIDWHKATKSDGELHAASEPHLVEIDKKTWFQRSSKSIQNSISPFVDALPEAIKFTRYRSPVIPTRPGMQLWSIDQISRSDFFAFSDDDALYMSDREQVPDDTVVRFINSQIDQQRLESLTRNCSPGRSHSALPNACQSTIAKLSHQFAGEEERGWEQVSAVIRNLRQGFQYQRFLSDESSAEASRSKEFELEQVGPSFNDSTPLERFLEKRVGPSYLFATTAALMLEHLGYQTRLVTGFYVQSHRRLSRGEEIAVLPRDSHVWLEINVGHGYWIPLEPTPGFLEPRTTASFWYQLYKARTTIAIGVGSAFVALLTLFALRRFLFEAGCRLVWPVMRLLNHRKRVVWLAWVLDRRLRLAGVHSSAGTIQRSLFLRNGTTLPKELRNHLQRFFDDSDRIYFGNGSSFSKEGLDAIRHLWNSLTVHSIRRNYVQPARNKYR